MLYKYCSETKEHDNICRLFGSTVYRRHGVRGRSCAHLWLGQACGTPVIITCCSQHRAPVHELQSCACTLFLLFAPELYPYLLCFRSQGFGLVFRMAFFFPAPCSSFGLIKCFKNRSPRVCSFIYCYCRQNDCNTIGLMFIKLVLLIMLHYTDYSLMYSWGTNTAATCSFLEESWLMILMTVSR